ncbi:APC family permease [Mycoplasma putrefaciens]|uniref:APC family permease n=1 Tax=Mycoplasma putrefaciens TaxID=2123 RepID=UPI000E3EDECB|nr:APC family permease [Mycoplasma putrefaciens]
MKNKGKMFEFLTLFAMVIGTVVGAGIYIKNKEVLTGTHNPIIAIILWLIVGLSCVAVVYLFLEISSSTLKEGSGTVSVWAQKFINRKWGSFFSVLQSYLYAPIIQSVFTATAVSSALKIAKFEIPGYAYVILMLVVGIAIIAITGLINILSLNASKKIQTYGTIFKFIPLIIALIGGFTIAIIFGLKDGTFGNNGITPGIAPNEAWSINRWEPLLFFRGFGGILFAFDGFIYICNSQKRAKHKDVVPKALLFGMVFVALFYSLMAISLFLGSPDGTIEALLKRMLNKGQVLETANIIISLVVGIILIIVPLLGVMAYSYIAITGLESDIADNLHHKKIEEMSIKKIGITTTSIAIIAYSLFIIVGAFSGLEKGLLATYSSVGVAQDPGASDKIANLIGIFSSASSCFSFGIVTIILIAALWNRKTNKVEVQKRKGFVPICIASIIAFSLFTIMGIFTFAVPLDVIEGKANWFKSTGSQGPIFVLSTVLSLGYVWVLWYIQERKMKVISVNKNDTKRYISK